MLVVVFFISQTPELVMSARKSTVCSSLLPNYTPSDSTIAGVFRLLQWQL